MMEEFAREFEEDSEPEAKYAVLLFMRLRGKWTRATEQNAEFNGYPDGC